MPLRCPWGDAAKLCREMSKSPSTCLGLHSIASLSRIDLKQPEMSCPVLTERALSSILTLSLERAVSSDERSNKTEKFAVWHLLRKSHPSRYDL